MRVTQTIPKTSPRLALEGCEALKAVFTSNARKSARFTVCLGKTAPQECVCSASFLKLSPSPLAPTQGARP